MLVVMKKYNDMKNDLMEGNKLKGKDVMQMSEEELRQWEIDNGVTGYDILRMPGCPRQLPTARSMTQARNDYYHLLPTLIQWYNQTNLAGD